MITNISALCSAIVLQAVKDYQNITHKINELNKQLPNAKARQAESAADKCKARLIFKARKVYVPWQAKMAIAVLQELQTATERKEIEEMEFALLKCKSILTNDIIAFFKSEWCERISPLDGNEMLISLKRRFPIKQMRGDK